MADAQMLYFAHIHLDHNDAMLKASWFMYTTPVRAQVEACARQSAPKIELK